MSFSRRHNEKRLIRAKRRAKENRIRRRHYGRYGSGEIPFLSVFQQSLGIRRARLEDQVRSQEDLAQASKRTKGDSPSANKPMVSAPIRLPQKIAPGG